jgi:DNA replication factor Dna2
LRFDIFSDLHRFIPYSTVCTRYDTRIAGGDIFHIIDFNMEMFLSRTATHTASIFTHTDATVQEKDINSIHAKIDNENGLLVQHPDMLISPTRIADAIGCVRRGVISERGKALGGFSKPAVLGNLRHSFIEVTITMQFNLMLIVLL